MNYVLDHTGKPYAKYFEDISAIPRGSFKEDNIAGFVENFAKTHNLAYTRDKVNNIVIRKPAAPGYEDHETVMLQGHMDMIWAKRPGSTFNFETEPLEFVVKDGYLMAKETTCGSDDGVAIAYMLAILADNTLKHPELECVFTTAEEPGIIGAQELDCSQLKARKYISMDGNLEGTSLLITSGGTNGDFIKEFTRVEMSGKEALEISISGLTGGHAQNAQNKELLNAVKAVVRILYHIKKEIEFNLIRLDGGSVTTIPVSSTAKIALAGKDIPRAREIAERITSEMKFEHKESDPNITLKVERFDTAEAAMDRNTTDSIVTLIYLQPVGLVNSSLVFPGLPITSIALEVIETEQESIVWRYKPQSAIKSKFLDMEEQARLLGEMCGVKYHVHSRYFGHNIEAGSPFYQVFDQVWFEETGKHIVPIGAHYGNEIGLFLDRMPYLDVILLVATHYDAHTPDERLDLASFDRCYKCLVKILERV
jgi:dipeptidase D